MTAQIGENLSYEGHATTMCSEPLGTYFRLAGVSPSFAENCTALWRGYVGSWEIRDDRLYLTGLEGTLQDGSQADGRDLLPGLPRPRLCALVRRFQ